MYPSPCSMGWHQMIFRITPQYSLSKLGRTALRRPARAPHSARALTAAGARAAHAHAQQQLLLPARPRAPLRDAIASDAASSRGGAGPGDNGATFQNVGGGGAERPPPCPGASEGAPRRAARGALMGNRGPSPRYDRYRDSRESGRRHGDLHRREDRGAPRGAEGPGAGSSRSRRVLVGARFLPRLRPVPTCL